MLKSSAVPETFSDSPTISNRALSRLRISRMASCRPCRISSMVPSHLGAQVRSWGSVCCQKRNSGAQERTPPQGTGSRQRKRRLEETPRQPTYRRISFPSWEAWPFPATPYRPHPIKPPGSLGDEARRCCKHIVQRTGEILTHFGVGVKNVSPDRHCSGVPGAGVAHTLRPRPRRRGKRRRGVWAGCQSLGRSVQVPSEDRPLCHDHRGSDHVQQVVQGEIGCRKT